MTLTEIETLFTQFENKMLDAGIEPIVISAFKRNYLQLISGATGMITSQQIDPVENVPDAEALGYFGAEGRSALARTAVIKLNGGLGTGMGLERAKSLIDVKNGLTFLDIIARQILSLREREKTQVPLIFMNSFNTRADTAAALAKYENLRTDIPPDFLQHRIPKVHGGDFTPAWSMNPDLEWCPPGHGDIYLALLTSGILRQLLEKGYEYAFVSNADNLGAVLDLNILGYFASEKIQFMMEVADRTPADRKGGHLARTKDGSLTLRELSQCPEDELTEFQDIFLYRYFNTNSLWLHLPSLAALMEKYDNILPLPLIRNIKTVDPKDPSSPKVYQLETAMGAAISLFEQAAAMRVPRTRFAPVKTTDDLLAVWSDAYLLTEDYRIIPNPARVLPHLTVSLDRKYYGFLDQLHYRFPAGAPSLIGCSSLTITGDIVFGKDVTLKGNVVLAAERGARKLLPDGAVIEGEL